jgi:UDP-N-acetylglucosamine--dolichyl-phosphate N-acetylglucosaminephosphotransferase
MADILNETEFWFAIATIVALVVSGLTALLLAPIIMKRMKERRITGQDWNKKVKTEIPELGGIAILFAFPIGISVATGILKLTVGFEASAILAAIGVLFIGGMIGLIDDISHIPQKVKAVIMAFAALPLIIAGTGLETIPLPFGLSSIDFMQTETSLLFFWMIIVPIGVTGAANAMNMSAGYNGLETGQVVIVSVAMLSAAMLIGGPIESALIFAALMGAAIGLNYFNGYPAITFVGDVGTLSMGAVIATGVIIGNLELAGMIAIAPTFYELAATAYYSLHKIERKAAMANPIIDELGKLHPPKGAERYTLSYWLLSKKPMTERNLVRVILGIYAAFGAIAIAVAVL